MLRRCPRRVHSAGRGDAEQQASIWPHGGQPHVLRVQCRGFGRAGPNLVSGQRSGQRERNVRLHPLRIDDATFGFVEHLVRRRTRVRRLLANCVGPWRSQWPLVGSRPQVLAVNSCGGYKVGGIGHGAKRLLTIFEWTLYVYGHGAKPFQFLICAPFVPVCDPHAAGLT
eukprot:SAG22_NODE_1182_length_5233_cov_12.254188_9_plen_169_part_00